MNTAETIDELVTALGERGLTVRVLRGGIVVATNSAGEPPEDEPLGRLMSPGLSQKVECRPRAEDAAAWWHWVWTGPTRDAPPEYEPLCPVENITRAADRIARVLALRDGAGP